MGRSRTRRRGRRGLGGHLTLEKYHRFFVDPWDSRLTVDHLNHIIFMHGFAKLHHENKGDIMDRLVGEVDLQPPRRSTLHCATPADPPSTAVITTAQARTDVDAIGWAECPISCVAAFAAGDAPELVEPTPRPADFVVTGRRARSKQRRSSVYQRRQRGRASKVRVNEKEEEVVVQDDEKDGRWLPSPPPSPPPLSMRSPTPPPPPLSMRSPTPPPPPRHSPRWGEPTLSPLPLPPGFDAPTMPVPPPHAQLSWGQPLPTAPPPSYPEAPPCGHPPPPPGSPLWTPHTVQPSYLAPFWGAPSSVPPPPPPPPPPHVPWSWPPHGLPAAAKLWLAPPHLLRRQPPPHLQGKRRPPPPPPGVLGQTSAIGSMAPF